MDKNEELELLKIDLENAIGGMMLADESQLLSGRDKELLNILKRCQSVLDRIEPTNEWIPITTKPMTEEEKELFEYEETEILNCPLPDEGEEVLITYNGCVEIDTFIEDLEYGCYFEDRDINEVDAWMPLPEPYKTESEEKQ